MQIAINNKNEIIGYASAGQLANGIDCNVIIPADFAPGKYLLTAEETDEDIVYSVIPNPDYIPHIQDIDISQEEYNIDFDFRLSCLELGL